MDNRLTYIKIQNPDGSWPNEAIPIEPLAEHIDWDENQSLAAVITALQEQINNLNVEVNGDSEQEISGIKNDITKINSDITNLYDETISHLEELIDTNDDHIQTNINAIESLNNRVSVVEQKKDTAFGGKTIVIFGDSNGAGHGWNTGSDGGNFGYIGEVDDPHQITADTSENRANKKETDGFPAILRKQYPDAEIINYSVGGSGLLAPGIYNANYIKRYELMKSNINKDTPVHNEPDIIIIWFGGNDPRVIYNYSTSYGQTHDLNGNEITTPNAARYCGTVTSNVTSKPQKNVSLLGNLDWLINSIQSDFPQAKIKCILNTINYTESTPKSIAYSAIYNMLKLGLRKWSIPTLDLREALTMVRTINSIGNKYFISDKQHYSKTGWEFLTPIITDWLIVDQATPVTVNPNLLFVDGEVSDANCINFAKNLAQIEPQAIWYGHKAVLVSGRTNVNSIGWRMMQWYRVGSNMLSINLNAFMANNTIGVLKRYNINGDTTFSADTIETMTLTQPINLVNLESGEYNASQNTMKQTTGWSNLPADYDPNTMGGMHLKVSQVYNAVGGTNRAAIYSLRTHYGAHEFRGRKQGNKNTIDWDGDVKPVNPLEITSQGERGDSVTLTTGVNTIVKTLTMQPGQYLIIYSAGFASNATGSRSIFIKIPPEEAAPIARAIRVAANPTVGLVTNIQLTCVLTFTTATQITLNAHQNSGSDLNVTPAYTIVKLN